MNLSNFGWDLIKNIVTAKSQVLEDAIKVSIQLLFCGMLHLSFITYMKIRCDYICSSTCRIILIGKLID